MPAPNPDKPAPGVVTLDLHGRTTYQARVAIDAALRRAGSGVYRLRLVHGHLRGDALRSMIRSEYAAREGVLRVAAISDGMTELVLREY